MKARILPLDSDEHQSVQRLLPWYVNGTLDSNETLRVQTHLAGCPRCQGDVKWQGRLRASAAGAATSVDVDRDWVSMRRRLSPTPAEAPRTPRLGWRWPVTRWLQLAVGVEGALVLALAVAWLGAPRDEPFRALGAGPSAATANALIVFRPDATEAEIRQALRASGARLVGGPTVADAYLLHLPARAPESLSRLRAEHAVKRIESLEAQGPR